MLKSKPFAYNPFDCYKGFIAKIKINTQTITKTMYDVKLFFY